ncbi:unnamed protein product [Nezara viridula]|uniref:vitamin-K-epoxide reductase (warfarin-sensitive) n=1 Tax=Nezara viridula TaxID=85310 RepID=A0A9P0HK87_NEZVI|nr:unnamed protein product [Nezara viridula]
MPVPNAKQLHYINFSTTTACFIGFALSLYSLLVEINIERNPTYTPMCDISPSMSCTKAFGSQYGKGFGIIGKLLGEKHGLNQPNSLYGMAFYTLCFFITMVDMRTAVNIMIGLAILSNLASLYLASLLIFVLQDFCIVCVSTYFVNATLLFLSMYKKRVLFGASNIKSEKSSHAKED